MKKLGLMVITLFLLALVAGCGDGGNGNGNGNGNGGDTGNGVTTQWMAYAFDQVVKPASGGSGKIETFVLRQTMDADFDGELRIEGSFLGKVNTNVKTTKTPSWDFNFDDLDWEDLDDFDFDEPQVVENSVQCYAIKHHITIEGNPDWAGWWSEVIIYIPVDEVGETYYGWVFAKAEIEDSVGQTAEFGYYLTQEMKEEGPMQYMPYMEENDVMEDIHFEFFGLYGWAWAWFGPFTASGTQYLEEKSWSFGGMSYDVSRINKTVGAYTFDAWSIEITWTDGDQSGIYKAICSPDLALPIYLEIGEDEDEEFTFVYELIDLTLK